MKLACLRRMGEDERMDPGSLRYVSDDQVGSIGEFLEHVGNTQGPTLKAHEHRAITEGIKIDRERQHDVPST